MKRITLDFNKPLTDIRINKDTEITGLYLGKKNSILHSNFNIIQSLPGCHSRVHIKAVLYDNAILELDPKMVINKGARQTDSHLKIEVLLIGDESKATVIPGLEIMEDDVKAGHAAVIGRLDREQLYYLMSRGIPLNKAKEVLINAFILGYN